MQAAISSNTALHNHTKKHIKQNKRKTTETTHNINNPKHKAITNYPTINKNQTSNKTTSNIISKPKLKQVTIKTPTNQIIQTNYSTH